MLVLEVRLAMVTDDPVGVGGRGTSLRIGRCNLSMQVVVQAIEKTLAQVHVADWVDAFGELHAAGNLTIAMSPMMLDTLHVPLINDNDNLLSLSLVDLLEKILISLVNHYLLDLGEEDVRRLDHPVHFVRVEHLLRVRLRG